MNYCANVNFLYPNSIKIAKGDVYFEFEGTGFWLTVFDRAPSVTSLSINNKIVKVTREDGYKYHLEKDSLTFKNQMITARDLPEGGFETTLLMETDGIDNSKFSQTSKSTFIRVAFDISTKLNDETMKKALNALNYFIRTYRHLSKDTSVKEVDFVWPLKPFSIIKYHEYTMIEKSTPSRERIYSLLANWSSESVELFSLQPIKYFDSELITHSENEIASFVAYSLINSKLSKWQTVLTNAFESATERGNYNSAIVETFTELERSLFAMTKQLDGRNKYDTICKLIRGAFYEHFPNKNNLKSKLHKLRIKRNDIIYEGIDASKPDCESAFEIALEAFEFIDNVMN